MNCIIEFKNCEKVKKKNEMVYAFFECWFQNSIKLVSNFFLIKVNQV